MGVRKKVGRPSKYPSRLTIFVSQDTYDMVMYLKDLYREGQPDFLRRVIQAGVSSLSSEAEEKLISLQNSLSKWEKTLEKEEEKADSR
ncbi:MAG: hypothetical protein GF334_04025 [Candidatus Altiarchaeales archaeon]|nr:hypothetical protein [Candidatus Altiarchaeales archaeon]